MFIQPNQLYNQNINKFIYGLIMTEKRENNHLNSGSRWTGKKCEKNENKIVFRSERLKRILKYYIHFFWDIEETFLNNWKTKFSIRKVFPKLKNIMAWVSQHVKECMRMDIIIFQQSISGNVYKIVKYHTKINCPREKTVSS